MKYFKIEIQRRYKDDLLAGRANGEKIKDGDLYFDQLSAGEILEHAPVFDPFFLERFDTERFWEWNIFDVHDFWLNTDIAGAWLVSNDLKLLLENFNLPKPYYFYPSKLKYNNNKCDYYIYQFAGDKIVDTITDKYIIWESTSFINEKTKSTIKASALENLIQVFREVHNKYGVKLKPDKIVINEALDFFPLARYFGCDIVSERLKTGIEEMGITGFEFSELDYEVVVEG